MRGHFGVGIYQPKTAENVGGLWRSAHAFGASYIFTIGARYRHDRMDVSKAPRSVPLFHYDTPDEAFSSFPAGSKVVAVEYPGKRVLQGYGHPEQAVYLLGAEDHGIPAEVLDRCESVVEIGSCGICLNVATAGSSVMYDRVAKMTR